MKKKRILPSSISECIALAIIFNGCSLATSLTTCIVPDIELGIEGVIYTCVDRNGQDTGVKCDCTDDTTNNNDEIIDVCKERFDTQCINGAAEVISIKRVLQQTDISTDTILPTSHNIDIDLEALASSTFDVSVDQIPLQQADISTDTLLSTSQNIQFDLEAIESSTFDVYVDQVSSPAKKSCLVPGGDIGRVVYTCLDENGSITDVDCECTEDDTASDDCEERFGTRCIDGAIAAVGTGVSIEPAPMQPEPPIPPPKSCIVPEGTTTSVVYTCRDENGSITDVKCECTEDDTASDDCEERFGTRCIDGGFDIRIEPPILPEKSCVVPGGDIGRVAYTCLDENGSFTGVDCECTEDDTASDDCEERFGTRCIDGAIALVGTGVSFEPPPMQPEPPIPPPKSCFVPDGTTTSVVYTCRDENGSITDVKCKCTEDDTASDDCEERFGTRCIDGGLDIRIEPPILPEKSCVVPGGDIGRVAYTCLDENGSFTGVDCECTEDDTASDDCEERFGTRCIDGAIALVGTGVSFEPPPMQPEPPIPPPKSCLVPEGTTTSVVYTCRDENGSITDVKCKCTEDDTASDDCEERFGTRCIDGGLDIRIEPPILPEKSCVVPGGDIGRVAYTCLDENGSFTGVDCECTEDDTARDDCEERFGTRCIDGAIAAVGTGVSIEPAPMQPEPPIPPPKSCLVPDGTTTSVVYTCRDENGSITDVKCECTEDDTASDDCEERFGTRCIDGGLDIRIELPPIESSDTPIPPPKSCLVPGEDNGLFVYTCADAFGGITDVECECTEDDTASDDCEERFGTRCIDGFIGYIIEDPPIPPLKSCFVPEGTTTSVIYTCRDENDSITDVKCKCTEDDTARDDCEERFGTRCIDGGLDIRIEPPILPEKSCVVPGGDFGRVVYTCVDENGRITDVDCECTEDDTVRDDCEERFGTRCIDGAIAAVGTGVSIEPAPMQPEPPIPPPKSCLVPGEDSGIFEYTCADMAARNTNVACECKEDDTASDDCERFGTRCIDGYIGYTIEDPPIPPEKSCVVPDGTTTSVVYTCRDENGSITDVKCECTEDDTASDDCEERFGTRCIDGGLDIRIELPPIESSETPIPPQKSCVVPGGDIGRVVYTCLDENGSFTGVDCECTEDDTARDDCEERFGTRCIDGAIAAVGTGVSFEGPPIQVEPPVIPNNAESSICNVPCHDRKPGTLYCATEYGATNIRGGRPHYTKYDMCVPKTAQPPNNATCGPCRISGSISNHRESSRKRSYQKQRGETIDRKASRKRMTSNKTKRGVSSDRKKYRKSMVANKTRLGKKYRSRHSNGKRRIRGGG